MHTQDKQLQRLSRSCTQQDLHALHEYVQGGTSWLRVSCEPRLITELLLLSCAPVHNFLLLGLVVLQVDRAAVQRRHCSVSLLYAVI